MTVTFHEYEITKNQGLKIDGVPTVRLKDTQWEEIVMKTKTKMGWVDHVVAEVPKSACLSRLENWRKLLKAPIEQKRRIRLQTLDNVVLRIDVWVTREDPQVWDSEPLDWTGEGWLPFFFYLRHGTEDTTSTDDTGAD